MGHAKRAKKQKVRHDQYLHLSYPMLASDAWRSLSGAAVKIYFELHLRFHGGNNGKLRLSLDGAARELPMCKRTVANALKELETKGFIVKTKPGSWYGRKATEYALTTKDRDGSPATFAYKNWKGPRHRSRKPENSFLGVPLAPSDHPTMQNEHQGISDGAPGTPVRGISRA